MGRMMIKMEGPTKELWFFTSEMLTHILRRLTEFNSDKKGAIYCITVFLWTCILKYFLHIKIFLAFLHISLPA